MLQFLVLLPQVIKVSVSGQTYAIVGPGLFNITLSYFISSDNLSHPFDMDSTLMASL